MDLDTREYGVTRKLIGIASLSFSMLAMPVTAFCAEYKVGMEGWEFNPAKLTVKVGDTVIWINDDDTKHKIAFEDASLNAPVRKTARSFAVGDKFSLTFTKAGVFKYFCNTHESQDMLGVVVVEDR